MSRGRDGGDGRSIGRADGHGEDENDILSRLLRERRLAAGVRQEDLAQMLGHHQSFVSRYERAQLGLTIFEIRAICKALGTSFAGLTKQLDRELGD